MNKAMLGTATAVSFAFLGLFGPSDQSPGMHREYGSLSGSLQRTMAQDLPPYHQTADTTQQRLDSGTAPGPTDPARPNPTSASEQTPKVQ